MHKLTACAVRKSQQHQEFLVRRGEKPPSSPMEALGVWRSLVEAPMPALSGRRGWAFTIVLLQEPCTFPFQPSKFSWKDTEPCPNFPRDPAAHPSLQLALIYVFQLLSGVPAVAGGKNSWQREEFSVFFHIPIFSVCQCPINSNDGHYVLKLFERRT